MLSSVQNAAQTDRKRGVALWVVNNNGTRPSAWVKPYHAASYLAGLWDFSGTNVVGVTNQVSVADIDPAVKGPEMLFAGFVVLSGFRAGALRRMEIAVRGCWR